MSEEKQLEAIKQGAKEAIMELMRGISDMPGSDIFDMIKEGMKDATLQWLERNKKEIIESISKSK